MAQINARSESLLERPAFSQKEKHCKFSEMHVSGSREEYFAEENSAVQAVLGPIQLLNKGEDQHDDCPSALLSFFLHSRSRS